MNTFLFMTYSLPSISYEINISKSVRSFGSAFAFFKQKQVEKAQPNSLEPTKLSSDSATTKGAISKLFEQLDF
jgi:hypothetical protein